MATDTTDAVRAVKPGDLPRLTKPQMARLVEVGLYPTTARTDIKVVTTAALIEIDCLDLGRQIKGDLYAINLTPLGIRILAGFPGDEFDRFRDALTKEPTP